MDEFFGVYLARGVLKPRRERLPLPADYATSRPGRRRLHRRLQAARDAEDNKRVPPPPTPHIADLPVGRRGDVPVVSTSVSKSQFSASFENRTPLLLVRTSLEPEDAA